MCVVPVPLRTGMECWSYSVCVAQGFSLEKPYPGNLSGEGPPPGCPFPPVRAKKRYVEAKTLGAVGYNKKEKRTEPFWVCPTLKLVGTETSITELAIPRGVGEHGFPAARTLL